MLVTFSKVSKPEAASSSCTGTAVQETGSIPVSYHGVGRPLYLLCVVNGVPKMARLVTEPVRVAEKSSFETGQVEQEE